MEPAYFAQWAKWVAYAVIVYLLRQIARNTLEYLQMFVET